ncbi:hypothetical protein GOP47_0028994 [Adiantum capillus-veneris]|nr:hypothetical protein GOP47_0028994 [Adiantum capillus-veneris]
MQATYTSSLKENNFALENFATHYFVLAVESHRKDNGGMGRKGLVNKLPPSPQTVRSKMLSLEFYTLIPSTGIRGQQQDNSSRQQ